MFSLNSFSFHFFICFFFKDVIEAILFPSGQEHLFFKYPKFARSDLSLSDFSDKQYYSILISLLITDVSCKLLVNHYYISISNLYFLRLIYCLLNVRAQVLDFSSNSFCYEDLFHFIRTVHLVPDHMGHSIQERTK